MSVKSHLPMPSDIRDFLRYESDTGALYWTRHDDETVARGFRGRVAGTRADGLIQRGYRKVIFRRKMYLAHRLAYWFGTGVDPGPLMIDHKNGVKDDNRLENLRICDRVQNLANQKRWGRFKKGVSFYEGKASRPYAARITVGGAPRHLGYFDTEDEAHAAYCSAAACAFGEFARFE